MNPDNSEDLERQWLRHPATRTVRREIEARLQSQRHQLIDACAVSPDPVVRDMLGRYRSLQEVLGYFDE